MSLSIGGVDLFNQGLNNEYRIMILERVIDKIIGNSILPPISQLEIDSIKTQCLAELQNKYPQAGITGGSSK